MNEDKVSPLLKSYIKTVEEVNPIQLFKLLEMQMTEELGLDEVMGTDEMTGEDIQRCKDFEHFLDVIEDIINLLKPKLHLK